MIDVLKIFVIILYCVILILTVIDTKTHKKKLDNLMKGFEKSCNKHLDEMEKYFNDCREAMIREFIDDLEHITIQCFDVKVLEKKYKERLAEIVEENGKTKPTNL